MCRFAVTSGAARHVRVGAGRIIAATIDARACPGGIAPATTIVNIRCGAGSCACAHRQVIALPIDWACSVCEAAAGCIRMAWARTHAIPGISLATAIVG